MLQSTFAGLRQSSPLSYFFPKQSLSSASSSRQRNAPPAGACRKLKIYSLMVLIALSNM